MKFLLLSTLILFSFMSFAQENERSEDQSIRKKAGTALANIDIAIRVNENILDFKGFELKFRGAIESRSGYNGKFLRGQRYSLSPNFRILEGVAGLLDEVIPVLDLTDTFIDSDFPFIADVIFPSVGVELYQLVDSKKESLIPFKGLFDLPLNSQKFMELAENTSASFPYGFQQNNGINPTFQAGPVDIGINLFQSVLRNCTINVFKYIQDGIPHARIRVFIRKTTIKNNNIFIPEVDIGVDFDDILPFGQAVLANSIGPSIYYADLNRSGEVVLLDYILDMSSAASQAAYDEILKGAPHNIINRGKDVKLGDFLKRFKPEGEKKLIRSFENYVSDIKTDFTMLDQIIEEDNREEERLKIQSESSSDEEVQIPYRRRRAIKVSEGINFFDIDDKNFDWDLGFMARRHFKAMANNYYLLKNSDNEEHHIFSTSQTRSVDKFGRIPIPILNIKVNRRQKERQAYIFAKGDPNSDLKLPLRNSIQNIGLTYEFESGKLKKKTSKKIRERIESFLPDEIDQDIPWEELGLGETQKAALVYYNISTFPRAIQLLSNEARNPSANFRSNFQTMIENQYEECRKTCKKLKESLPDLFEDHASGEETKEKMNAFIGQIEKSKHQTKAFVALFSLIETYAKHRRISIKDLISIELRWTSNKVISNSYIPDSVSSDRSVFRSIEFITSIINSDRRRNNRIIDTRLLFEQDSGTADN